MGPVAHGKDGFLDTLYRNQLRTYLLTGDALLALILAALEGTEPNLQYTREPYESFTRLHERIDNSVFIQANVDDEDETPVYVLTIGVPGLPEGVELRVEPSRVLYSLDRAAFIEVLAASTTEVLHDEEAAGTAIIEAPSPAAVMTAEAAPAARFAAAYKGSLDDLRGEFARYLKNFSLEPEGSLTDPVARLADSLLETADYHMGIDWREREAVQSGMRVALRRVLARFGVAPADAKQYAEHIVSWLRIQTAADVTNADEVTRG